MKNPRAKHKSTNDQPRGRPSQLPQATQRIRKPRPLQGLSARLTAEQKETLFVWLAEGGLTYAAALPRVAQEFGIETTDCALSNFWKSFCSPRLLQPPPALPVNTIVLEIRLDALTGQVISVTSKTEGKPTK